MISKIYVYIHLPDAARPVPAGLLTLTQTGGEVGSRFAYGKKYLDRTDAVTLDPASLPLDAARADPGREFWPTNGLALFGAFRDATPDAWGRRVLERQRKASSELPEAEYLLGSGQDRVGALEFRGSLTESFGTEDRNSVFDLEYLVISAERIEKGEPVPAPVLQLLLQGTSLGGARPKATVEDGDGLWLAKFPASGDRFDQPLIEFANLRLARACGIRVPETKLVRVLGKNILLVKRFDRQGCGAGCTRTHFASALTLLGLDEMDSIRSSYAAISEAIGRHGSRVRDDRVEMFRRMAFNIICGNTDDHLRNHGFLMDGGGWRLSPAYDLVPTPAFGLERYQNLGVGGQGRLSTLDNALSACGVFGLDRAAARQMVCGMLETTGKWPEFYRSLGVPDGEAEKIRTAFRPPDALGWAADDTDFDMDRPPSPS